MLKNPVEGADEQVIPSARAATYGDHLDQQPAGVLAAFNNCKALIAKINAAGGNAQMIWPPDLSIRGNSHMMMLDKNNLQLADLIRKWIDKNVKRKKGRGHDDDDDNDNHHHRR